MAWSGNLHFTKESKRGILQLDFYLAIFASLFRDRRFPEIEQGYKGFSRIIQVRGDIYEEQ